MGKSGISDTDTAGLVDVTSLDSTFFGSPPLSVAAALIKPSTPPRTSTPLQLFPFLFFRIRRTARTLEYGKTEHARLHDELSASLAYPFFRVHQIKDMSGFNKLFHVSASDLLGS